jgi:hypothetical protein
MLRAQVLFATAMGMLLLAGGCGGGGTTDPIDIMNEFESAGLGPAREMYKGKAVRLRIAKVSKATEEAGSVSVQGQTGKIMIMAGISGDAAEKAKALGLKVGGPATLEGEVVSAEGDWPRAGLIFMKSAKVVP